MAVPWGCSDLCAVCIQCRKAIIPSCGSLSREISTGLHSCVSYSAVLDGAASHRGPGNGGTEPPKNFHKSVAYNYCACKMHMRSCFSLDAASRSQGGRYAVVVHRSESAGNTILIEDRLRHGSSNMLSLQVAVLCEQRQASQHGIDSVELGIPRSRGRVYGQ